jgi:asparagine synthase (glutamine-hydrolysing)
MSKKFDGYFLDPSSRMFEILRAGPVKNLLDDHKSGRNDHYKILFSLVVLEEWLRAFAA